MNNVTAISVVCTAEAALKRLKRAGICVYGCKKRGAAFVFAIKDKDVEKAFAIFAKPCYNVKVVRRSRVKRLLGLVRLRAGLFLGAAAFIALALASDMFMLKIEVSGSGSYLEAEVRRIVYDEGAGEGKLYASFNFSAATGRILALPQVTFCHIARCGSVLVVDVQTDEEHAGTASYEPLISDADGTVRTIVAVCGTAAVAEGDSVKKGDTLIHAYTLAGENKVEGLAAGYAELECAGTAQYFSAAESRQSLKEAYASLLLEEEDILTSSYTVKPTQGGVLYVIEFTYLHKLSINLT